MKMGNFGEVNILNLEFETDLTSCEDKRCSCMFLAPLFMTVAYLITVRELYVLTNKIAWKYRVTGKVILWGRSRNPT